MAKGLNKLTARTAQALTGSGRHSDGGGLYLDITPAGAKSWVFMFKSPVHRIERRGKPGGKQREMGFGAFGSDAGKVTLAGARDKAEAARLILKDGRDPLDERDRSAKAVGKSPTFGEIADQFLEAMRPSWKNDKHAAQWVMTLREYAAPLRSKPVNEIEVADVLAVLKPHWEQRPETADRLRGRIERVLNAGKAAGHRTGENPAAWRGHLENLLPKRSKLTRGHHAALPWQDVPAFVADLRTRKGFTALALEFLILTATRSGEARGARWDEIDIAAKVWTIPAARMKAGRAHRVPLTSRILEILATVEPLRTDDGFVFPSLKPGRPLSDMTLGAVLRRMKIDNATPHGFRSCFRDWAGSATSFPREIAEEALAHVIGDRVERAYRRQDALERRREMMAAWEQFLSKPAGANIVPLVRSGA